ncbi:Protein polybromo-1 [Leucoagaricus sp. SymC.cos]|nr:Protein polybromo-1 [Leucoagaricus sp. SymC.cos]
MSKRELSRLIGTADIEGSRPKRRRDAAGPPDSSPEVNVIMSEPGEEASRQNGSSEYAGGRSVKEQGLHLLQTVKEAKANDGRLLATAFLTKPPRKVYPDYYQIIQKPIALDDIKKLLDIGSYSSPQAVRADFELLFNNALEYNMKDSVIWKDAKDMLKLVQKTYEQFAPLPEPDGASDDDEKRGKSKTPSLNRMIKSRLQKLVEKTDKDGRTMSTEFMELPNKKQWAIYYKQIKKPQCLENIFRKIKRKEYHSAAAFASDVELVFSNAMTFNQDHTVIWEDALALRDYFRQLMADLPPPHNLLEYSINKVITNKIKIKPPVAPSTVQSEFMSSKPEPSTSTLLLRVPAANTAAAKSSQPAPTQSKTKPTPVSTTPAAPYTTASASITPATTAPVKTPVAPQLQRPTQQPPAAVSQPTKSDSATPQPVAAAQTATYTYSHYYQPAATPAQAPSATPTVPPTSKITPALLNSRAPTPIHPNHQIKFVKVRIQPQGRLFWLDHREGVKTWVVRLGPGETGVQVDDLVFMGDEDGDETSDEEEEDLKQEEEDDMDVDGSASSPKNGKARKGKPAIRRSQRTAAKVEEVLLKLNGTAVKEKEDTTRQWDVSLPVGSNILEVGEKGGLMWKVHIERIADL